MTRPVTSASSNAVAGYVQLVRTLDYPVYIATTSVNNEPSGCLIGFATQCSVHPPRFLACISKKNHTFKLAKRASVLAVHVVDHRNRALAELFGGETGDETDKFKQVHWRFVDGAPVLDNCARWFTGRVLGHLDLGDHMGHLLEPVTVETGDACDQMTYQKARNIPPGHKP
jgi:flavin reductase (DIM6/NTAB) family NADH-FMN oxidoreductase RutF